MRSVMITLLICLVFCPGCAHSNNVHVDQRQSNLAAFLFGGSEQQSTAQKVPLIIPARIGVTFVPGDPGLVNIPDTTKKEVIEAVRSQLAKHTRYVAGAQSIPPMYLIPKGGVNNLEQVARQFDVDVIVLMGANQIQKYERNPLAAFMDITVIGAFIIPGNTVDTSTVLEAAVYHVPSRALIFRTDGANQMTSRSTQFGSSQSAQNDAVSSIEGASRKLVVSIADALVGFENFDVSKSSEIRPIAAGQGNSKGEKENYWREVREYRSTGGGSFDATWIIITGVTLICTVNLRKQL